MNASEIRALIGGSWEERADGWWRGTAPGELRGAARAMRDGGARFAALVPSAVPEGMLRLTWHWDVGGTLLTLDATVATGVAVPSIVDLLPAADWAEREARDYYAVAFEGRPSTAPLMLRDGDTAGVMLGKGARP
jgi:respiratory-subunit NADH dehydrogenase subunit